MSRLNLIQLYTVTGLGKLDVLCEGFPPIVRQPIFIVTALTIASAARARLPRAAMRPAPNWP
jgi:hypothetical protein